MFQELGWRGFFFTYLAYAVSKRRSAVVMPTIRKPLAAAVYCGLLYWAWHIPLARQRLLWRVCGGKTILFFKVFPVFCIATNVYWSATYQMSGLSVLFSGYTHAVIDAALRYFSKQLPLVDEEVVLWAVTTASLALMFIFSPVLLKHSRVYGPRSGGTRKRVDTRKTSEAELHNSDSSTPPRVVNSGFDLSATVSPTARQQQALGGIGNGPPPPAFNADNFDSESYYDINV
eukprot:Selendium_serpulae@DN1740_c0_g1_i1.p1